MTKNLNEEFKSKLRERASQFAADARDMLDLWGLRVESESAFIAGAVWFARWAEEEAFKDNDAPEEGE